MKVHIYKVIIGKGSRATIVPRQSASSLVHSPGFVRADEFNSMLRYLQQEFYRDYGGIYAEEHEPWLNERLDGYIEEMLKHNHMVATYRLIESAFIAGSEVKSEDLFEVNAVGNSKIQLSFKPTIQSTFSLSQEEAGGLQELVSPIIKRAWTALNAEWYQNKVVSPDILIRYLHHKINQNLRLAIESRTDPELIRLFGKLEANTRQKFKN